MGCEQPYIHTYTVMHSHVSEYVLTLPMPYIHTYIYSYTFYCCMYIGGRISRCVALTWDGLQFSMRTAASVLLQRLATSAGVRPIYTIHPRDDPERDEPRSKHHRQHTDRHRHMVRQVTYKENPSYIHTYPYTCMTGYDSVQNHKHTIHTPYYTETID